MTSPYNEPRTRRADSNVLARAITYFAATPQQHGQQKKAHQKNGLAKVMSTEKKKKEKKTALGEFQTLQTFWPLERGFLFLTAILRKTLIRTFQAKQRSVVGENGATDTHGSNADSVTLTRHGLDNTAGEEEGKVKTSSTVSIFFYFYFSFPRNATNGDVAARVDLASD